MKVLKYLIGFLILVLRCHTVLAQCPTKVLHFEEEFDAAILSPADWRENSFAWNKLRTRTWGKQDNSLYDLSELQYYTQYDDLTENPENNFILGYDNNPARLSVRQHVRLAQEFRRISCAEHNTPSL